MSSRFEELAWQQTPMGAISLRRRLDPTLQTQVYEVKLDDDFLMSSAFTAGEIALARVGLARVGLAQPGLAQPGLAGVGPAEVSGPQLDVVVGGLGLGYTACAVLDDERVASVLVVDALAEVIRWHEDGLLPDAQALRSDGRARLLRGDFFALAATAEGFDPLTPQRLFDAVLLDVDHTPRHVLHPSHAAFYEPAGLRRLARHLRPGGVFALWSDDPPDDDFMVVLAEVFRDARSHVERFPNPLTGGHSTNTVYTAR